MSDSTIQFIAIASSLLHVSAYVIYAGYALRDEIKPNPTSWLMWTYGTALVIVLEWDQDAAFSIMLLPIICASCSLIIALFCWQRGRLSWPQEASDQRAFLLDLSFTALYILLIVLELRGYLSMSDETFYKSALLVLVSGSTFVSFWPIIRSTWTRPENEHWLAWSIWTLAYGFLLVVTLAEHGSSLQSIQFWAYPASCLVPTGVVGLLALRTEIEMPMPREQVSK